MLACISLYYLGCAICLTIAGNNYAIFAWIVLIERKIEFHLRSRNPLEQDSRIPGRRFQSVSHTDV